MRNKLQIYSIIPSLENKCLEAVKGSDIAIPRHGAPDIRKVCAEDASLEVAVLYDPAFIYVIDEFYFCKHLQAILYAVE